MSTATITPKLIRGLFGCPHEAIHGPWDATKPSLVACILPSAWLPSCKSAPRAWLPRNGQLERSSSSWLSACSFRARAWLPPWRWRENPRVTALVLALHRPRSRRLPPYIAPFPPPPSLLLLVAFRLHRR